MKLNAFTISVASFILSAGFAFGGEITITNASFESPNPPPLAPEFGGVYSLGMNGNRKAVTGWRVDGGGGAGVLNLPNVRKIPGIPPTADFVASDGDQVGYIAGFGKPTTLTQTLEETIKPDTIYTLSIDIAAPAEGSADYAIKGEVGTNYSIGLYKGFNANTNRHDAVLLSTFTPVVAARGTWTTVSATFNSAGSSYVGSPITITLGAVGNETSRSGNANSGTFYFDNVHLKTAVSPGPPPGSLSHRGKVVLFSSLGLIVIALLGLIAFSRSRRKGSQPG